MPIVQSCASRLHWHCSQALYCHLNAWYPPPSWEPQMHSEQKVLSRQPFWCADAHTDTGGTIPVPLSSKTLPLALLHFAALSRANSLILAGRQA